MSPIEREETEYDIDDVQGVAFRSECDRIPGIMESIDSQSWRVADGYFRMGTLISGSSFWTGDLRVNEGQSTQKSEVDDEIEN